ncbi:hypothetical protein E3T26_14655 [Cryobacterium sp. TMT1-21]|uniref:Isocitrate lyase/phosphoenolpyruvate mutase family protein n=1 Tax=Cryobacterium shii TaxID=1259235 RepID=A0AAQ2C438_9MICO|nr:hypothetical protein E3O49_14985 [Cryobacterium shii]TFD09570.1 hypothetical protein E3T26_14655 [Cryobacterium sp. TMT1-21]
MRALGVLRVPAVDTTSFGIAASAGLPDGGRARMVATSALAAHMCLLPVHVTADIEDGYSDDPVEIADLVAKRHSPDVFINARVDNFGSPNRPLWMQSCSVPGPTPAQGPTGSSSPELRHGGHPEHRRGDRSASQYSRTSLTDSGRAGALGVRRVSSGSLLYRSAVDTAVNVARALRNNRKVPVATPDGEMQSRLVAFSQGRAG